MKGDEPTPGRSDGPARPEGALSAASSAVASLRGTPGVPLPFTLGQDFWPGLEELTEAAAELLQTLLKLRSSGGHVGLRQVILLGRKPDGAAVEIKTDVQEPVLYYKNTEYIGQTRAALIGLIASIDFFIIYNEDNLGPNLEGLYDPEAAVPRDVPELIEQEKFRTLRAMIEKHSTLLAEHAKGESEVEQGESEVEQGKNDG